MCALSAVEGELSGVLGGVFMGGIGVRVIDLCSLAGGAGQEGVEVVEEDGARDGGKDVTVWRS